MLSFERAVLVQLVVAGCLWAENWPGWRGPRGNGHSAEKNVPVQWGPEKNTRWKVKLPMGGNSSPVVWENQIFLTQALDRGGHKRALLCFDRKNGKELWRKVVTYQPDDPTHKTNPYCSPTPVTDGERVIVNHGSAGMYCYDMKGNELWKVDLGKLSHVWGYASSPILYADLAILWCGPCEGQYLLAVNKETGKEVWRHDEPGGQFGKKEYYGSWSTPIIVHVDGHDELVLSASYKVKGFDPKTGKELWHCDGLKALVYTSAVASEDGIIVAMGGYGSPALAVRAGGKGDVTKTHRLWHHTKRNPQRIGSGAVVGDHLYILSSPGQAQCFELKTGKEIWGGKRLGNDQNWSSMVVINDKLYVVNTGGDCFVLKASPEFEQIAVNQLNEMVRGSIAVSDGELFIRSYQHLWCIGDN